MVFLPIKLKKYKQLQVVNPQKQEIYAGISLNISSLKKDKISLVEKAIFNQSLKN